jgi:polysaccharide export outer membrane protein
MTNHAIKPKARSAGIAAFVVVAQLLAGCSGARTAGDGTPIPSVDHAAASQYQIGPGDHLQVFVYQSPTLSVGDVPVRPDGRLSLPLVPDIVAAGKTPSQLSSEISDRLKEFVKDPNVSVIVHGFVGTFDRQIRVIGEATEPLALPYSDRMTVLDVMIAAKGLTKYASGNSAVIVRRTGGQQQNIKVRLSDLLKDGDVSQNVEMQPGDTLIIPQTWF